MRHDFVPRMINLEQSDYQLVRRVANERGLGNKGFSAALRMIIREWQEFQPQDPAHSPHPVPLPLCGRGQSQTSIMKFTFFRLTVQTKYRALVIPDVILEDYLCPNQTNSTAPTTSSDPWSTPPTTPSSCSQCADSISPATHSR